MLANWERIRLRRLIGRWCALVNAEEWWLARPLWELRETVDFVIKKKDIEAKLNEKKDRGGQIADIVGEAIVEENAAHTRMLGRWRSTTLKVVHCDKYQVTLKLCHRANNIGQHITTQLHKRTGEGHLPALADFKLKNPHLDVKNYLKRTLGWTSHKKCQQPFPKPRCIYASLCMCCKELRTLMPASFSWRSAGLRNYGH